MLAAFAVYVATSLYLLFHPRLLHRRRSDENRRRFRPYAHVSHRGGAAEAYENTIGAFRWAGEGWIPVLVLLGTKRGLMKQKANKH